MLRKRTNSYDEIVAKNEPFLDVHRYEYCMYHIETVTRSFHSMRRC